jgi:hypothetical protein
MTLPASDRSCVSASAVVPRFKFPTKIRAGMAVLPWSAVGPTRAE